MAVTLVGCAANVELDRKIDQVTRSLTDVEARGALRCAPRELAVARSQLEFARLERAQGFPARARYHIDIADENVRAAKVLSPPGRCSGAEGAPAVRSTEAPGDTDSP